MEIKKEFWHEANELEDVFKSIIKPAVQNEIQLSKEEVNRFSQDVSLYIAKLQTWRTRVVNHSYPELKKEFDPD